MTDKEFLDILQQFTKEWSDRNEYYEDMDEHYIHYPNSKPDDWEQRYVRHFQIEDTLNKLIEQLQ